MQQHNVWCKCVAFCVGRYVGQQSNIPPHTERYTLTPSIMLPYHHIWLFTFLNFKFSDFKKELYELPEDDLNNDRNMLECF